ncbi:hypothetical protein SynRS9915_01097 [Synechococcus sp. RS9915]|nr:hypothetical protein SynRS9915_01097 [Synechococcus sp. RS9915]
MVNIVSCVLAGNRNVPGFYRCLWRELLRCQIEVLKQEAIEFAV